MAVFTYTRDVTSGTGTNLTYNSWAATIEQPAYEAMTMIQTLDEGQRPYSTHNIRYWDTLAAQSQTAENATTVMYLTNMTGNNGTPTVLTYTSTFVYCVVGYNDDTQDAIEVGLDPGMRQNVEACIGEACDGVITALISNLTDGLGDAANPGTVADVRKLVARLRISSPKVMVGERTIYGLFHPGALDGFQNATEWMSAEVRGDAENPIVRGFFLKANGILFRFSTKVPTANGNGGEGAIYVPETFAVGWNSKPRMEKQRNGVATFHIGTANLGGRVKHDSRGKYYRTVVTV